LLQKFIDAENYDADVAKVAVMPREMEDVLTLLGVTLEAKKRISIPLIAISLGSYGAVTRLIGGVFGSSASFAVGHTASAPGQIPIEDLRTVLKVIEKTMKQ
jgi:3-dehydroquinate dehydratase-1